MADTTVGPDGALTGALAGAFTEKTYHDAIALVSEVVSYLENQGIADRDALDPQGRTIFAAESMRLTTRLMQVVSWFLTQRAVQSGELTQEQANDPSNRLGAVDLCLNEGMQGVENLPAGIRDLLNRSHGLFEQVCRVEAMMLKERDGAASPVHRLLDRLEH